MGQFMQQCFELLVDGQVAAEVNGVFESLIRTVSAVVSSRGSSPFGRTKPFKPAPRKGLRVLGKYRMRGRRWVERWWSLSGGHMDIRSYD